jgi:hypothetical protein
MVSVYYHLGDSLSSEGQSLVLVLIVFGKDLVVLS